MAFLCMITYTTDKEIFTADLRAVASALYKSFGDSFKVILCCESTLPIFAEEQFPIERRIFSDTTKYRRFIDVLENDDSVYYLSIDNDVKCDFVALKNFLTAIIEGDYDIGWGRIQTKEAVNTISKLVAVDKLLSHNILRPVLWRLGVGISVPGQIFCIKGNSYRGKLFDLNTFLDDLAVGLYSSNTKKKFLMFPEVLGFESPNVNFDGLRQQRLRWARGYASIFHFLKDGGSLAKIIIHAVTYHFLWLIHWGIFLFLINVSVVGAAAYVCLVTILMTGRNFSLAAYSLLYQLIFPIFHVFWIAELMSELNRLR